MEVACLEISSLSASIGDNRSDFVLNVRDARNPVQAQATKASDKFDLDDISHYISHDAFAHTHC